MTVLAAVAPSGSEPWTWVRLTSRVLPASRSSSVSPTQTMSPYQHGEVYVTDDGAETDLDLGH